MKFIGLKDPVGKIIRWENRPFTIIGVVRDLLVQSPYKPVRPSLFYASKEQQSVFILKMNPALSAKTALARIETIFKKYNPALPFDANFVDEEFAAKFGNEKRIGQLATFFAVLAIFYFLPGLIRAGIFRCRATYQGDRYP